MAFLERSLTGSILCGICLSVFSVCLDLGYAYLSVGVPL